MKRKSVNMMLLMLALLLVVAGCSSNNKNNTTDTGAKNTPSKNANSTPNEPANETPKEKTKVQIMSWWDFTTSEPLIQLKAKFEELNPDLELEYLQIGTGYADKVLTMIAGGGDLPDVMMLAMDKLPIFADKNAIQPLDKYITPQYKDSLYPVVSEALAYKGQTYAVARDITSKVMYLNKKMFDDAGVAYPEADWTWDEFRSIASKLSKDGQQWGFYFPKFTDGYTSWLMQNGGGYATNDGASLLGKAESIEALKFLQEMVTKDKSVPTESQAQQFGTADTAPFIAGKVAMITGGLSSSTAFKTNNVEYLVRPLPQGKVKLSTSFVNSWVIPKGAKDVDLSWRVLEFLSSKEAQQIALDTAMGLPAAKDVDTAAFLSTHEDNKYFIEALDYSVPFPTPLYGADFALEVTKQFDLMWLGEASVEDAVAKVEKAAPNLLAGKK
ncbi:ABC transporter substrate-binding protein [Paenibacillus nasutitermitis]|uniref:Sugar ABC transporter substrate-binding protein n=1 Tax=Paenibacillus nasutitermitis TaxID=1652958 RepID=A0A917DWL3_9BACL|nr:sugar ABC transporter substrate-binding protein [Paenibacillus nasutitermitis]GGD77304.1 sugar ABC transporter substrate-binding protein [Paenibacillus nasutitermitis]